MKNLLLLTIVLFSFWGYGQRESIEIDREWAETINPYFENLEKERVPHGILLDYAMEFTDVAAYNGILTDSTSVDVTVFGNIYKTLLMGRVIPDTTFFPRMETVASQWLQHRNNLNLEGETPVLVLSGLYYNYARFDESALDNGRIHIENDQYHDVYDNGVWQNPYEELETVAYALPVKNVRGSNFEVVLPEELFLTNHEGEPLHIEIDFGDGQGYRALTFGEHLPVSYTEDGVYHWRIRTVKEGAGEKFSSMAIGVSGTTNPETVTVFIPGPNSTSPSAREGAWVHIRHAPGHNGQIRKPFIVAEGFDTGSILTPEILGGDRTLSNLLAEINSTIKAGNLSTFLFGNNREYDLIYIDWQNGTHNIKHNAEVLRNVITWVNQQKLQAGSTEENVLLGQSMGGLVGRYALAKMEQVYGEDHDVRLYIAHDSPMRGANLPISTQFATRHFYDQYISSPVLYGLVEFIMPTLLNFTEMMSMGALSVNFPAISDILTLNDTPAAVQMSYHYVDILSNPSTTPHEIWQNEFDAMGYPQNSWNVAISNGNECAADHGFSPGAKIIDLHETQGFNFWGDLLNIAATPVLGVITTDPALIFLGILPGSSFYQYDFDIHTNPLPNSINRRVYYGRIRYKKKFLWIGPTITHAIMDRAKDAPVGYLPFDYYSGGYYDIRNVTGSLPFGIAQSAYANPQYGFIPVASSLDVRKDNNQELNHNDYLKNYAGGVVSYTGLTSGFNNFIVDFNENDPINNRHISFQARNGNWLAKELDEVQPVEDCSFVCDNQPINGPELVCGSPVVFSVEDGANSYEWQVQNSSVVNIHGGTTGNNITISRNGNASGWVTLEVNISSPGCGSGSRERTVYVGSPTVESVEEVNISETQHLIFSPPPAFCDMVGLKLNFAPSLNNVEEVEWEKVSTNFEWTADDNPGDKQYVIIIPYCNDEIKFKVRAKNSCGWSDWQEVTYNITQCDHPCPENTPTITGDNFVIYPVPASTNLHINLKDTPQGILGTGETINIKLYNNVGNLLVNLDATQYHNQINITGYPAGYYTLVLNYNGQQEGHQIILGS